MLLSSNLSPHFVEWNAPTYRPSDGQFSAGSSTPTDIRGRHHRNCNETATEQKKKKKNVSPHALNPHKQSQPTQAVTLSWLTQLKHPSSVNTVSMSSPAPNSRLLMCAQDTCQSERRAREKVFLFELTFNW